MGLDGKVGWEGYVTAFLRTFLRCRNSCSFGQKARETVNV